MSLQRTSIMMESAASVDWILVNALTKYLWESMIRKWTKKSMMEHLVTVSQTGLLIVFNEWRM